MKGLNVEKKQIVRKRKRNEVNEELDEDEDNLIENLNNYLDGSSSSVMEERVKVRETSQPKGKRGRPSKEEAPRQAAEKAQIRVPESIKQYRGQLRSKSKALEHEKQKRK